MAALSLTTFVSLPAHAGLFSDEEARKAILDLRTKLDALQQDTTAKLADKADKSSTIDMLNQNEQTQQEIAKLRGQLEVLANDLANAQQRQKDFYVDLDTRLRNLEPKKVTLDGRDVDVAPTEQKAFESAMATFKNGDYQGASVALVDFLRRYPQSAYAADAQNALGNSYYVQNDYKNAVAALQVVVKNYPDSPKVPEALLSIASCDVALKDKTGAKRALETLIDKYPDSSSAHSAKDMLRSLK
jgi:tol-pal system protein YbgF